MRESQVCKLVAIVDISRLNHHSFPELWKNTALAEFSLDSELKLWRDPIPWHISSDGEQEKNKNPEENK